MSDEKLREQVKVSKEFLESAHGRVLKYGTHKEAKAYYEAIKLVENALGCKWDIEKGREINDEMHQEFLKESRQARAEGHRAATLQNERNRGRNNDGAGEHHSPVAWATTLAAGIAIGYGVCMML